MRIEQRMFMSASRRTIELYQSWLGDASRSTRTLLKRHRMQCGSLTGAIQRLEQRRNRLQAAA